jgi:putative DNA primase/helicase
MLGAVTTCDGTLVTVHRTYVDLQGHKAAVACPKKVMAPQTPGCMRGAAIQLFPATTVLAVTEGIETALAIHRLSGWPTWSCISAGGLEQVALPGVPT